MAIETLESLREHLQWAIEIEHATLPPYLSALYSIKEGHNQESYEVIESVFMEEMLHMTLAANILNAIGGSPQIDKPDFIAKYPTYLPHSDEAFLVSLGKFSKEAIEVFLKIEKPEEDSDPPEEDKYHTIGQFYDAIEKALIHLCHELGEENVFTGDPSYQIRGNQSYYGGSGTIIAVENLETALEALEEIKEQGEGLQHHEIWDGDRNMFHPEREEVAHYFRFNEILLGKSYQLGDTPQSGPTGESFEVDWDAVYNVRPNPQMEDYPEDSEIRVKMELFNKAYTSILHLLHQTFNGKPDFLAIATGAMYELKFLAIDLMQTPSGDGETTAGPSFEYIPVHHEHIEKKVVILPNGPYIVYGNIPLVRKSQIISEHGEPMTWKKDEVLQHEETYALCRCGKSSVKPYCDGTHAHIKFDGTETARTEFSLERQTMFRGHGIVVKNDGYLCMESGFCGNRLGNLRQMVPNSDDTQVRATIISMIERCPSGAFTYSIDHQTIEPDYPEQIAVTIEDGMMASLWITGGIHIERADGQPFETRNRVTLCRCGRSKKKPLCDGMHRVMELTE